MGSTPDLSGQRFGLLVVIRREGTMYGHAAAWLCRCDCGKERVAAGSALRAGTSYSCGCVRKHMLPESLVGRRFGRLLVESQAPYEVYAGRRRPMWRCICDCGKPTVVLGASLRKGLTRSCGCFLIETLRREAAKNIEHGQATSNNGRPTVEYRTWSGMIGRCHRPNTTLYHQYGGRGIKVCEEWRNNFQAFFEHVGPRPSPRHSIDRINNDGNYEPGNVRWATRKEQQRNMRSNRMITVDGKTMTVAEFAERAGVPYKTIYNRVRRGDPLLVT